jgi:hypothetical protein
MGNRQAGTHMLGAAVIALSVACGVGACSASDSTSGDVAGDSVDRATVASQVADQLAKQVGRRPDAVTCPRDLPSEIGASIRCELTDAGQTFGITVRTTSVLGSKVNFNIEVDKQPAAG